MTAKKAAPAAPQVPASRPVRIEIRVNNQVRFVNTCYDPELEQTEDGTVSFTASLHPRLVDAPPPKAIQHSEFHNDPRNGEQQIWQVHSGRRT